MCRWNKRFVNKTIREWITYTRVYVNNKLGIMGSFSKLINIAGIELLGECSAVTLSCLHMGEQQDRGGSLWLADKALGTTSKCNCCVYHCRDHPHFCKS